MGRGAVGRKQNSRKRGDCNQNVLCENRIFFKYKEK